MRMRGKEVDTENKLERTPLPPFIQNGRVEGPEPSTLVYAPMLTQPTTKETIATALESVNQVNTATMTDLNQLSTLQYQSNNE